MVIQNSKKMVTHTFLTLIFLAFTINAQCQVNNSEDLLITYIEESPKFDGDLNQFIQHQLQYPKHAVMDSIEGTVYISFWIDTLGLTYDIEIAKSVRYDLDNEALRLASLIKFYKPAMQRNKPISVRYILPVTFKLLKTD